MKAFFGPTVALVLATTSVALAGDEDTQDDAWTCTCTATCDGNETTISIDVCADDDAVAEAVSDAATSCARQLDGRCEALGTCHCHCNVTGDDC
jgi:hypothetical protein